VSHATAVVNKAAPSSKTKYCHGCPPATIIPNQFALTSATVAAGHKDRPLLRSVSGCEKVAKDADTAGVAKTIDLHSPHRPVHSQSEIYFDLQRH
jgi:hypothetical protein